MQVLLRAVAVWCYEYFNTSATSAGQPQQHGGRKVDRPASPPADGGRLATVGRTRAHATWPTWSTSARSLGARPATATPCTAWPSTASARSASRCARNWRSGTSVSRSSSPARPQRNLLVITALRCSRASAASSGSGWRLATSPTRSPTSSPGRGT